MHQITTLMHCFSYNKSFTEFSHNISNRRYESHFTQRNHIIIHTMNSSLYECKSRTSRL